MSSNKDNITINNFIQNDAYESAGKFCMVKTFQNGKIVWVKVPAFFDPNWQPTTSNIDSLTTTNIGENIDN